MLSDYMPQLHFIQVELRPASQESLFKNIQEAHLERALE